MALTITLGDEIASRAEARARELDLPVEAWITQLIAKAELIDEAQVWEQLNARRCALIEKRSHPDGLSSDEERELAGLNDSVDRALEPWDNELLESLKPHEAVASSLITDG